jgi:hypothetical protein
MDRIRQGNQRTEELNDRMGYRNVPSAPLQPQFDIRPLSSKYAKMPIVDRRANCATPIQALPTYNIAATFNPGNAQAPWSGFASNINDESRLRNQFFALQRGAGQSCYIPSKDSDLYKMARLPTTPSQQQFPGLFEQPQFEAFNPSPKELGGKFFENFTRQQVKELT